jgi:hypothetical protein
MKKPAKKIAKKHAVQELTAQVRLEIKSDTPSYYVNYIGVSHTGYDFTLSAAKIPSPLMQDQVEFVQRGEPIPIELMLQLVIPPLLVDGLLAALADQKERYEKTLAQQVKNNDIQHQHIKTLSSVH